MKKNKSYLLALAFIILYFMNRWIPSFQYYYNVPTTKSKVPSSDFYAYYLSGQAYLKGVEPYRATRGIQPFIYPPTFIPLYGQLAKLDYMTARTLWFAIYLIFYFSIAAFLIRMTPREKRIPATIILLGLTVYSYPLMYHIRQGQMDMISSGLSFLSLLLYLKKRPNISAICLAAAVFVKINPIMILATYVIFLRDWKYLLRFSIAALAILLISIVFFPPDWYRAYVMEVLPRLTKGQSEFYNQSLLRFFAGDRWIPRIITVAGYFSLSAFAWWLGGILRDKQADHIYAFYLLNVAVTLLISGSAWVMAYTWFLLPIVPVILYVIDKSSWIVATGIAFSAVALQSTPLETPIFDSINMLGAILCVVCTAVLLFKEARQENPLLDAESDLYPSETG